MWSLAERKIKKKYRRETDGERQRERENEREKERESRSGPLLVARTARLLVCSDRPYLSQLCGLSEFGLIRCPLHALVWGDFGLGVFLSPW